MFATGAWTVTFDKPLQPGVLSAGNWSFRATNTAFAGNSATAAGSVVSGGSLSGLEDNGPDVANYAASPADVLDLQGRPATAFTDFPLVVT